MVLADIVHFLSGDLRKEVVIVIVERAEAIVEDYQNEDESNEFDAVDRVRKTTQDLAEKTMEYDFIEALAKIKE